VSAVARESGAALLVRRWRNPAAWATATDIFVILIAVSLPWSTTLVGIFAAALIVSTAPFLDARAFLQSLKRPICALPIVLFALAVVGTLWSNAPWATLTASYFGARVSQHSLRNKDIAARFL